jgi:multiple antibiotic resistance protein
MSSEVAPAFLRELARAGVELFVIVDPLGNLPIFIGLTKNMGSDERKRTFRTAVLVGFVLLTIFASAGQEVLALFGITLSQFMVAGGILLLALAVKLLVLGGWTETTSTSTVGAFPMACPLLVGPGAITATIVSLQTRGILVTFATVLVVFFLVAVILSAAEPIHRVLGDAGATVVSGVMAIIIAAIAVGFISRGIVKLTQS